MHTRRRVTAVAMPLLALLAALLLGASVATAQAPDPLTLTITAGRAECTEATLNPVTWTITGGSPPYTVTVAGAPVAADATSANATCGTLPEPGEGETPVTEAPGTITATVTDATGAPATASATYTIVPPLPAPVATAVPSGVMRFFVGILWSGLTVPASCDVPTGCFAFRSRLAGEARWDYGWDQHENAEWDWPVGVGRSVDAAGTTVEAAIAAMRHPIEIETPDALQWSATAQATSLTDISGLTATATHDTITVRWNRQPSADSWRVYIDGVGLRGGQSKSIAHWEAAWGDPMSAIHEVTFTDLPPDTKYEVAVWGQFLLEAPQEHAVQATTMVRTAVASPDHTPLVRGPQNLRATATHDTITVSWDHPRPDVKEEYRLYIESPYGGRFSHFPVWPPNSQETFDGLLPNTTYLIRVIHDDITRTSSEITITTKAAPPAGATGADQETGAQADARSAQTWPLPSPFAPVWPVPAYSSTDNSEHCATTTAADCIRAVYKGAPNDYAQVQDIPADKLLTPGSDGRYTVERGQQVTVVTAAPLPTGYTRFYLQRRPTEPAGTPDAVSFSQLIKPVGTTYTFTLTTDERGASLVTFDLRAARPRPFARPGHKPEVGAVVVTTEFQVATCETGGAVANPTTNTALVADCDALLAMRDAVAGTATLNWSAGTPMSSWDGVTVAGTPQRVTQLSLASSSLTGELPRGLGDLTGLTQLRLNDNQLTGHVPGALATLTGLTHLYLAGNTGLTGCIPPALCTITNNDMASLALPDCAPLALTLTAERAQCSEATLNPVTWTITGGSPPYTVTVDGATAAADATSVNATCGTLPEPAPGGTPLTEAPGTIPGTVTDATGAPATASAAYTIVPPLPAPTGVGYRALRTHTQVWWDDVTVPATAPSATPDCPCPLYLLRWRMADTTTWAAVLRPITPYSRPGNAHGILTGLGEGTTYELAVAALRDAIEQETPNALNWGATVTATTVAPATGVRATATHDAITVTWDPQPSAKYFSIGLRRAGGGVSQRFTPDGSQPHEVVFRHLPPETEYTVRVGVPAGEQSPITEITVSTTAPPADWTPLPRGPQNLRTAVTHNSVTVTWDAPHAGAHDVYHLTLVPPAGLSQHVTVHGGVTAHTFTGLHPATSYQVFVRHSDIVVKRVETSVTTAAAPTAAQSTRPVETECFAPQPISLPEILICEPARTPVLFHWPVAYDDSPSAGARCTANRLRDPTGTMSAPMREAAVAGAPAGG